MKTKEQIIKSRPVYLHDWSESKRFGVIGDFEGSSTKGALDKHKDEKILFATYTYACYSGDAWVLFEKGGNLFEVNGSHCSCYGLEDQWAPEEVSLKQLENRLTKGTFGTDSDDIYEFKNELMKFLGIK